MSTTVSNANRQSPPAAPVTYRAAVVHAFGAPLTLEQVPARALEPDQIRVRIEACGLCHTDIHAAHGDWPIKPQPQFIPGHEAWDGWWSSAPR